MAKIDPIVIREVQLRQRQRASVAKKGDEAGDALIWFMEYATLTGSSRESIHDIIESVVAKIVASATPNAKIAQEYLNKAAASFKSEILDRAAEMAYADYEQLVAMDK